MALTEYAPATLVQLFERVRDTHPQHPIALGGIVGDAAHTYGYHRARFVLPASDYSVQLPRDRRGDPGVASALDLTPEDPEVVQRLTRRLTRAAARRDLRVERVVREFYGTLNGSDVYGYDLATRTPQTSDDSHLWHLHISFYRDTVLRPKLILRVAEVLAEPYQSGSGA